MFQSKRKSFDICKILQDFCQKKNGSHFFLILSTAFLRSQKWNINSISFHMDIIHVCRFLHNYNLDTIAPAGSRNCSHSYNARELETQGTRNSGKYSLFTNNVKTRTYLSGPENEGGRLRRKARKRGYIFACGISILASCSVICPSNFYLGIICLFV
jgi:hypothetical protein